MKVIYQAKEKEPTVKQLIDMCSHHYLKANKQTKDKECISCGQVIYSSKKIIQTLLSKMTDPEL